MMVSIDDDHALTITNDNFQNLRAPETLRIART
jgi:hypothetical protein